MKKAKDYAELLAHLGRYSDAKIGRNIAYPVLSCLISNFWLYADESFQRQYQRKEESRVFESLSDLAYGGRKQEQDFASIIGKAYEKAGTRIIRINHLCDAVLFAGKKDSEKAIFSQLADCLKAASNDDVTGRMLVYQRFLGQMEMRLVKEYGVLFH